MSDTVSEDDLALLKLIKKEVKDVPKGDNPQAVQDWMMNYLSKGGVTQQNPPTATTPTVSTVHKFRDPPRITNFSGNNYKGETSYELWRYEVTGLMSDKMYDQENINYAVRRSLKGDAGVVAMHLGPSSSVPNIILKLDSIYGAVENKEDLLAQFYRARQGDDESVTKWSCRLEGIIGRAVDRGLVEHSVKNTMLHSMLWSGLRLELKDISGHKFDTIKSFDDLRIALRQIEQDHEERKASFHKPQPAKAATGTDPTLPTSQMDEFKGLIHQLTSRMDRWETKFKDRGSDKGRSYDNRGHYNRQGQQQRYGDHEPSRQQRYPQYLPRQQDRYTDYAPRPQERYPDYVPRPRDRYNHHEPGPQRYQQQQPQGSPAASANQQTDERRCYRCGLPGHIQRGCTANLANMDKKTLNSRKPMDQDRR